MDRIGSHITRCIIAGLVALLPIGGLVITVAWLEASLGAGWLREQPFYFPGLGLLLVGAIVYVIGLVVTTFLGRWVWNAVDRLFDRLPIFGYLYRTVKQILGYGQGQDALFKEVVLVPSREHEAWELGLVTRSEVEPNGEIRLTVFVPGAPNPATGRLLILAADTVTPVSLSVSEAFKGLLSVGATDMPVAPPSARPS